MLSLNLLSLFWVSITKRVLCNCIEGKSFTQSHTEKVIKAVNLLSFFHVSSSNGADAISRASHINVEDSYYIVLYVLFSESPLWLEPVWRGGRVWDFHTGLPTLYKENCRVSGQLSAEASTSDLFSVWKCFLWSFVARFF